MRVEVRPIPQEKWHGKKNKESFAKPKEIEVLYDTESRAYATGLTPEEAKEYGTKLKADLSDFFDPEAPHPFWSSKQAVIKLPNNTNIFETDNPLDWVKVKNMKASKFVANSQQELIEGKWPHAMFVIFDESEEVAFKAGKLELKDQCVALLQKMTLQDKQNVVQVLSQKSLRGKSENFVRVEIEELINSDPGEFLRTAKMGREEVTVRSLILESLYRRYLTREGTAIMFMGESLGNSYEDAVTNLKDPNNNRIKIALIERVEGLKK